MSDAAANEDTGAISPDEFRALRRSLLLENLRLLPRMASAWVMTAAGALAYVWTKVLTTDQQQLVVEHSPLPVWSYPIVLTVLGYVARVWPQFLPPVDPDADLRRTR